MPAPVAVCVVAAIAGVAAVIAFHEVILYLSKTPHSGFTRFQPSNLLCSSSLNLTLPLLLSVGQRTSSPTVVLDAEILFLCNQPEDLGIETQGLVVLI